MLSGWIFTVMLVSHPAAATIASRLPAAAQTTPSTHVDLSPVTHLIQNLGHDIQHLDTRESGITVVIGAVAALSAHPADHDVANWARQQPPSSAATFGNHFGTGWVQGSGAVATWAIGIASHHREAESVGSDLIRAQLLDGVLVEGLKLATDRTRPNGGSMSFPSGHTSATMATAAVLQTHFGWKVGAIGYAFGGFVAWSRVRSDNHWLSDVMFGGAIGVMSGRTVARSHQASKWTVAPAKTPGGVAVYFIKR